MLSLLSQHQNQLPVGEVWLVGAGPGDPELISVRGLRLIRQADVVVHDRLVAAELIDERRKDALCIDVGKRPGHHPVPQQEIEHMLISHARAGKSVVRLKGGDPFIFGRGGEEMLALRAAGIRTHVVPGITAASACAASAGFPLTQRHTANNVCLTTAHHCDERDTSNWSSLAGDSSRTLVFYMGLSALGRIRNNLVQHGMNADTPCALIENGSKRQQRTVYCSLRQIADLAAQHKLQTPCLLVVGNVVSLAEEYQNQNRAVSAA
ncbi:MAG: uroporphyrinogen-III C-methyltransferase [Pseudohongiella sp.]|uniref:uroporphyrinogen-III C-methyltransferase n=1 Tax=Pseudohongiella sp. TaxID=1979412 RepID=UPI0034A024DD